MEIWTLVFVFALSQSGYADVIECGGSYRGDTSGNTTNIVGNIAPDIVYTLTLTQQTTLTVGTCGTYTDYDTYLRLFISPNLTTEVLGNNNGCTGTSTRSEMSATVSAGVYFVVVEGYNDESGAFQLDVGCTFPDTSCQAIEGFTLERNQGEEGGNCTRYIFPSFETCSSGCEVANSCYAFDYSADFGVCCVFERDEVPQNLTNQDGVCTYFSDALSIPDDEDDASSNLGSYDPPSTTIIAAAVGGGVGCLCCVTLIALCCAKRRKKKSRASAQSHGRKELGSSQVYAHRNIAPQNNVSVTPVMSNNNGVVIVDPTKPGIQYASSAAPTLVPVNTSSVVLAPGLQVVPTGTSSFASASASAPPVPMVSASAPPPDYEVVTLSPDEIARLQAKNSGQPFVEPQQQPQFVQPQVIPNDAPQMSSAQEPGAPPAFESALQEVKFGEGCWEGWKASRHLKAIALSLVLWVHIFFQFGCIGAGSGYTDDDDSYYYYYNDGPELSGFCAYTLGEGWLAVFFIVLFFYYIECWWASSRRYLSNVNSNETVRQYIGRLQNNPPTIVWQVRCYHYETRTRTVTDSNGNTRTETYTVRVDTHSASMVYNYSSWCDVSPEMRGFGSYMLTKITYEKSFAFADDHTRNHYNEQQAAFKRANDRDVHMDFWTDLNVAGFNSKMLQELIAGVRPAFLCLQAYSFCSFILLTVPYRVWFGAICGRTSYEFIKQIRTG